jgi:hypothetical protein
MNIISLMKNLLEQNDTRPYVPQHRAMNDEEAARFNAWCARSHRYDRIKVIAVLFVGLLLIGLAVFEPPAQMPPRADVDKTPNELFAEIKKSDDEHAAALQNLRISLSTKKQLEDLAALQSRYEQLKALTTGQEEIARAHRAILTERNWKDRLVDCLFGVFASLAATVVWERVARFKALQRQTTG